VDVRNLILKKLEEDGEVRSSDIVRETGYSRAYVNRFFRELREEGVLTLIGKANRARYIPAVESMVRDEIESTMKVRRILGNEGLQEDRVFSDIEKRTGIMKDLSENVYRILNYAFTEMLNNAIEHSGSHKIRVEMERRKTNICFEVRDWGIGIYRNIMEKNSLDRILDAVNDLLKGKQTTKPSKHSGEGIFFTSRAADILTIKSETKKLVFDNLMDDIYLRDVRSTEGTRVFFSIGIESSRHLEGIFRKHTDDTYSFNDTEVAVRLYEDGTEYVSRSQARRLVAGLEDFRHVVLDFKGVETVGQAFADEIFRVWHRLQPKIVLTPENANENIMFMIERARQRQNGNDHFAWEDS
jgi:anti-sigma regulatory factor (Ser/Thr protein kinase)